jgi:hypothetical protein
MDKFSQAENSPLPAVSDFFQARTVPAREKVVTADEEIFDYSPKAALSPRCRPGIGGRKV